MRKGQYRHVSPETLNSIEKAMELVQGSSAAVAKLLDFDPACLRSVIRYYPHLRARWGKTTRGPGRRLGFRIQPYQAPEPVPGWSLWPGQTTGLEGIKSAVLALAPSERADLAEWLRGQVLESAPSS